MCGQDPLRRFVIDDEVAAGADVINDSLLLPAPVIANNKAKIEIGCGGRRDDVGGLGTGGS